MGWSRAPAHHWQAVGDTGLVLWLQFERAELYAPVRRGLFWGFVLVAVVTAFGVVLVDSRIRPLARQLAQAEGHYQTVLETVDEGLMLIDASGRDIRLEVDGGIKVDNIRRVADAGADTFVAGSAIFGKPDYKGVIDQMRVALG